MKKMGFTFAEGATHVDMSDNISDNATNIVECTTHVDMSDNVSKCAFTLAEILIALGVIGVVAVLTLPPVIRHYNDKATVTKLKKVYSTFSQAHEFLKNDDEYAPENWDLGGQNNVAGAERLLGYYMKYVKNLKICNKNKGCFPKGIIYKTLDGRNHDTIDNLSHFSKAILSDGTLIYAWVGNRYCDTYCGTLTFDLNGQKGPNQLGIDTFEFDVLPQKIRPSSADPSDRSGRCSMKSLNTNNGKSCSYWVLMYENLDYRYCDGLSFNGKHSCKDK